MTGWTSCRERGKEKYIPNNGAKSLGKQSHRMLKRIWDKIKKDIRGKNCDDGSWM
jgi:hypothetical protein